MKLVIDTAGLITTSTCAYSTASDWDDFITTSVISALTLGGTHIVSSPETEIEIVRETANYVQSLSNEDIHTMLNDIKLKEQIIQQDETLKLSYTKK